jgi:hypothetical protein
MDRSDLFLMNSFLHFRCGKNIRIYTISIDYIYGARSQANSTFFRLWSMVCLISTFFIQQFNCSVVNL